MMASANNSALYIGVTNNLARRVVEHKCNEGGTFTGKYKCHKLVYYEVFQDIIQAIAREKQLKNWHREWKNKLISEMNPEWKDLSEELYIETK